MLALLLGLATASAALGAPSIRARIQPNQIALGQEARLEITVSGATNAPTPRPAPVPGLQIQGLGQTMSMQFAGGAMTTESTNNYVVRPERTGEFEIPAISLTVDGQTVSTNPLTLLVVAAGQAAPSARAPREAGERAQTEEAAEPEAPVAILEVAGLPERKLYVGEVVPVEIQLFIREGTRVTEASPPTLLGSGFTLHRNSDQDPTQRRVRRGDTTYTRLSFPAALSPISAGDLALIAGLDVTARVPKRVPRQRRRFDDPFFDSFFDSFAYRAVEQKIPVRSADLTLRVAPLPEEGRPASFSGAVGKFSMTTTAEPLSVDVGDPITARIDITGSGNFDRLELPPADETEAWRSYDPTSTFEAEDALGLTGRKTFEQALLPLHPDVDELPLPTISYFDPIEGRYVTLAADPLPIEVRAVASRRRGAPPAQSRAALEAYELAPNAIEVGPLVTSLRPAASRAWFLPLAAVPCLAVPVALWWGRRRRELAADPRRARALALKQQIARLREQMDDAVTRDQAPEFFDAARRGLQECMTGLEGEASAQSLTLRDMEERLRDDPATAARVRAVFEAADALAYGGGPTDSTELARQRDEVASLLEELAQKEGV